MRTPFSTRPAVFLSPVTCPECGWRGVPTIVEGEEQDTCPVPGCRGKLDLRIEGSAEGFTTERTCTVLQVPTTIRRSTRE